MPTYAYRQKPTDSTQIQSSTRLVPTSHESALPQIHSYNFATMLTADEQAALDQFENDLGYTPSTSGLPIAEIPRSVMLDSVAGQNNYRIPVGDWVLDAPGQTTLQIDQGTGFIDQAFGADYGLLRRVTPPATVADAAIGFSLVGGIIAAGWKLYFTWTDRRILTEAPSIAKVLIQAGPPAPSIYTVAWESNGPDAPDGVLVPELPGMQVEFWRQSFNDGGIRGATGALRREGRRYLPYYRGAVDLFRFAISDFSPLQTRKRNRFRVCYYDLANGARSLLSRDVIVVCGQQPDHVNGRGSVRSARSVWIE